MYANVLLITSYPESFNTRMDMCVIAQMIALVGVHLKLFCYQPLAHVRSSQHLSPLPPSNLVNPALTSCILFTIFSKATTLIPLSPVSMRYHVPNFANPTTKTAPRQ